MTGAWTRRRGGRGTGPWRRGAAAWAAALALAVCAWWVGAAGAAPAEEPEAQRRALLSIAGRLLDEAQVSYVYGGNKLGPASACAACNTCLETRHPGPAQRLTLCPGCRSCSLDCSHFTNLVYAASGLAYPYLETASMQALTAAQLRRNYHLVDLGVDLARALPGDLLVYNGHVAILERLRERLPGQPDFRGDVVHATGGRAVRGPGEGIQRERFVDLARFRGPLRRILRHAALAGGAAETPAPVAAAGAAPAAAPAPPARRKLRPVVKHSNDVGGEVGGDVGGGVTSDVSGSGNGG